MNSAAFASYRAAAELGDPDDAPVPAQPRCTQCGGWLRDVPDANGFDKTRDDYYEIRRCRRCGKHNWIGVF